MQLSTPFSLKRFFSTVLPPVTFQPARVQFDGVPDDGVSDGRLGSAHEEFDSSQIRHDDVLHNEVAGREDIEPELPPGLFRDAEVASLR